MFTSIPNPRTSDAIEAINANPFTRVVNVRFTTLVNGLTLIASIASLVLGAGIEVNDIIENL